MSVQITHWKETCEPHDCNLHVPSHLFLHSDHWVTATLTPGACPICSTKLIYWLQNYVIPVSDLPSFNSLFYLLSVIIIRCLIITAEHLNLIYCQWKTRSCRQVSQVMNGEPKMWLSSCTRFQLLVENNLVICLSTVVLSLGQYFSYFYGVCS